MTLRERNITLIDLKKYNDVQLTRISEIVGLVDGSLQWEKERGTEKIWFDFDNKMLIAIFDKEIFDSYKGLATNSDLKLSKKEKDYLLKMKPTEFNTKKKKVRKEVVSDVVDVVTLPVVLELDAILDKIKDYGIDTLVKEEKDFLDELSKS